MGQLTPKQFQLDAIEHVYRKLTPLRSRFLVADEVGLGKTIIARGVIQKFRQRLYAAAGREQNSGQHHQLVLYVCSSSDIGKQNIKKLMFEGGEAIGDGRASRLTMLFYEEAQSILKATRQNENGYRGSFDSDRRQPKLEVVCLTPATSFDFGFPEGKKQERQFIHALLSAAFQMRGLKDDLLRGAATSFFTPPAATDHWGWRRAVKQKIDHEVAWILQNRPDVTERLMDQLTTPFLDVGLDLQKSPIYAICKNLKIDRNTSILEVFKLALEECDGFLDKRSEWADQLRALRRSVIRRLREQVALVVVFTLQPDLVVLDEFQNFSELIAVNPAPGAIVNHVVRALFEKDARLLLLSATPYKATTADFEAAEQSHYRKFWDTIEFLLQFHPNGKKLLSSMASNFDLYRKSIQNLTEVGDPQFKQAKSCKQKIESELREVMVRTERFRYLEDPTSGVKEPEVEPWIDMPTAQAEELSVPLPGVGLRVEDVHYLAWLKKAFRPEQQMFLPEIWASVPYALNLMPKTYKMIGSLYTTGDGLSDCLMPAMRSADAQKYCPSLAKIPVRLLDTAVPNPKFRELIRQIKSEEIYRHLWIPPTKAYYSVEDAGGRPRPRKRLIFSRWQAVPQAVSVLTSLYVDEMLGASDASHGDTLKLSYNSVELAPILFHPSLWLAKAGLVIYDKRNCGHASLELLEKAVAARLQKELAARGIRVTDGRLDSFETIAAVLHRMESRNYSVLYRTTIESKFRYWPETRRDTNDADEADSESIVRTRIEALHNTSQDVAKKAAKKISRASLEFLTQISLGGPGASLLRLCLQFELLRFGDGSMVQAVGNCEPEKIFSAVLRTAHGAIRRFFNHSHAGLVIRKLDLKGKPTHLERTVRFCARNHLSAVMDELAFLMEEDLSPFEKRPGDRAVELIENLGSSFRIAVGKPVFREIHGKDRLRARNRGVSRHIAQAFVDERSVQDGGGKDLLRDQIRRAFNSPFWPFVLVTTSIGQEGLDFHRYCSDVIHWNLPHSPAAFEQREGRIQRYLGKAIRDAWVKGRRWDEFLDPRLHSTTFAATLRNPWALIHSFLEIEETKCKTDRRGLSPEWIYEREGEFAQIHRWIFCHPFSREAVAYRRMRDSVLLYRLALGQGRQDDLLRALSQQPIFRDANLKHRRKLICDLWIDLSPPRSRRQFAA